MKKIALCILIIIGILFLIIKGLEWRIEYKFHDIINSDPDRSYDITYFDFDLNTFFKGATLYEVCIEPLNPNSGTIITGHIEYAHIKGFAWSELFFGKRLKVHEIVLHQPLFEVILPIDSTINNQGEGFQELFGDILSRAKLNSFLIKNGSIVLSDPVSHEVKGQIKKINILATEIETDTLKLKNIIPFQVGDLNIDIASIRFKPNDYTEVKLEHLHYNLKSKELILNDISMGYSMGWIALSKRLGVQTDIVELNVKEIGIKQLEPSSNFYAQLDFEASKVSVDELNIKLQRNKNIPRPKDVSKPMFQDVINLIPLSFLIDSILISNSSITYSELRVNRNKPGSINIRDINGLVSNLTNMPKEQMNIGGLDAKLAASLSGKADINVVLRVPYDEEGFKLIVDVGELEMTTLNTTLTPSTGIEIVSGRMSKIQYYMNAGPILSQNKLVFNYNNLHMNLIDQKSNNQANKRALLSLIANSGIRDNNLPSQKNYIIAAYQSERNIFRSPINYINQSLIQGFTRIVPVKVVGKTINNKMKEKEKLAKD